MLHHLNVARRTPAAGLAALVAVGLLLGGCASKAHSDRMEETVALFERGQYDLAAQKVNNIAERSDKVDNHDTNKIPRDGLIARLEQGAILRAAGRIEDSTLALERANEILAMIDDAPQVKLTEEAAAALTNATSMTYRGTQYDRILLSVYLAMNYLEMGDFETARSYLRQAGERQQWASERFNKQIQDQDAEARSLVADKGGDMDALMADPEFQAKLAEGEVPPPVDLQAYADFRNPMAEFMTGVAFGATGTDAGDYEASYAGYRQARGLEPANPYLAMLEVAADDAASIGYGAERKPLVHVVYEEGMAPRRDQIQFALPLVLLSSDFVKAGTPGIALPTLEWGRQASPTAVISAGGQTYQTARLVDVNGLVKAEYDVEYPRILSRAIAATVTKALLTYAANTVARETGQQVGGWGGVAIQVGTWLGTSAYQVATNAADTRTWLTLPAQVQVASFPAPEDGIVEVSVGGYAASVELEPGAAGHVIFVRQPTASAPPAVRSAGLWPGRYAPEPTNELEPVEAVEELEQADDVNNLNDRQDMIEAAESAAAAG